MSVLEFRKKTMIADYIKNQKQENKETNPMLVSLLDSLVNKDVIKRIQNFAFNEPSPTSLKGKKHETDPVKVFKTKTEQKAYQMTLKHKFNTIGKSIHKPGV